MSEFTVPIESWQKQVVICNDLFGFTVWSRHKAQNTQHSVVTRGARADFRVNYFLVNYCHGGATVLKRILPSKLMCTVRYMDNNVQFNGAYNSAQV